MNDFVNNLPDRQMDFISREVYLQKIHELFYSNQFLSISAFGGTGKSALALEFFYRYFPNLDNLHVRWFNSNSLKKFEMDYREFAQSLKIDTDKKDINTIKIEVNNILNEISSKNVFFFLDNVENFSDINKNYFNNFNKNIRVLITSRNDFRDFPKIAKINLEPFNLDEAKLFIHKSLSDSVNKVQTCKILEITKTKDNDILPLKLKFVVAYIVEFIKKKDINSILNSIINADYHSDKVYFTLFHLIQIEHPFAFKILHYCSLLDADFISKDFLDRLIKPNEKEKFLINFDDNYKKLLNLSLLTKITKHKKIGFKIHRLIQEEFFSLAEKNYELDETIQPNTIIKNNIIVCLSDLFVYAKQDHSNKIDNEIFYRHVLKIADNWIELAAIADLIKYSLLIDKLADFESCVMFNFDECSRVLEKLLDIKVNHLPKNEDSIAETLKNLGTAYKDSEKYKISLEYYEKSLNFNETSHSEEFQPRSAILLNDIGVVYEKLGDFQKSIQYFDNALKICIESLPIIHEISALTLLNLGNAHIKLNKMKLGIEFLEKSYKMNEVLTQKQVNQDLNSSFKMSVLSALGNAYLDFGDNKSAIDRYEKALDIAKKILPETHPNKAKILQMLGNAYAYSSDHQKAVEIQEAALDIFNKVLPKSHLTKASLLVNLANQYLSLGEINKAISNFKTALNYYENNLPSHHIDVLSTMSNLACAYRQSSDLNKSIDLNKCILDLYKLNKMSEIHILIANVLSNLANNYFALSQYELAIENYEKSLDIYKSVLINSDADSHLSIATVLHNLGSAYLNLNKPEKSIKFFLDSLDIQNKNHSDNFHPSVLNTSQIMLDSFKKIFNINEVTTRIVEIDYHENEKDATISVLVWNQFDDDDDIKTDLTNLKLKDDENKLIHLGVYCDVCSGFVIGDRFKCEICENFDLCKDCNSKKSHSEHSFKTLNAKETFLQHLSCNICHDFIKSDEIYFCQECTNSMDSYLVCDKLSCINEHMKEHELKKMNVEQMIKKRQMLITETENDCKLGNEIHITRDFNCFACECSGVSFLCKFFCEQNVCLCYKCFSKGFFHLFDWIRLEKYQKKISFE